jgi:hypothetical protein
VGNEPTGGPPWCWATSEPSAGYATPGGRGHTFGDLARKVIDRDAELVVFFGGSNDVQGPPEQLGPAVLAAFTSTKAAAPTATLMVIGPVWPGSDPPSEFHPTDEGHKYLAARIAPLIRNALK